MQSHERSAAFGRPIWIPILLAAVLVATGIILVRPLGETILRGVGWALVIAEPVPPADIIVISLDSGGAGALEAADLVKSGIANKVGVFEDPPSGEDLEFIRRGIPYEDESARQIRQLRALGVSGVVQISRHEAGTGGEGQELLQWSAERQLQSIVFVVTRDHSRRARRVLDRIMAGHPIRVTVQPARYSSFDPDRWWETRGGMRTGIIEFEKLMLDLLLHPSG